MLNDIYSVWTPSLKKGTGINSVAKTLTNFHQTILHIKQYTLIKITQEFQLKTKS